MNMSHCCGGDMAEKTTTLKVGGMTCDHCAGRVKKNLNNLDGVSEVDVNLDSGEVKVTYDADKASLDQLKQAVKAAGYEVK